MARIWRTWTLSFLSLGALALAACNREAGAGNSPDLPPGQDGPATNPDGATSDRDGALADGPAVDFDPVEFPEFPGREVPQDFVMPEPSPIDSSCGNVFDGNYDADLWVPDMVTATADDRSVRLQWGGSLGRSYEELKGWQRIEGWRVCWGPSVSELRFGGLYAERIAQLFGTGNGVPLVAVVQSVDKLGRVSAPSQPVSFAGTRARVDGLRNKLTGFFDDFDKSEGALDELKWNVAASYCNDPTTSHTFIGKTQQAISLIGNASFQPGSIPGCDRDQNIARPRAVFDFTGREGVIAFDFEGAFGGRATWYVDVFPYEGDASLHDITAHVSFDAAHGHPGRFLRFSQANFNAETALQIHQYDAQGNPQHVVDASPDWEHPDARLVPGVLRHFELRISKHRAAIYVDGELLLENTEVELDFERAFVHWSQFAYNPIKEGQPWNQLRWDNFGFDGPAERIVAHNYKTSFGSDERFECYDNEVTWNLAIPDSIAGATSARLFYSLQTPNYDWSPSDAVTINGTTVALAEPVSPTGTWQQGLFAQVYPPYSANLEIPLAALQQGQNKLVFKCSQSLIMNPHVEVFFDAASEPAYTQPADVLADPAVPPLRPLGPLASVNAIDGKPMALEEQTVGTERYPAISANADDWLWSGPLSGVVTVSVVVNGDPFFLREQLANGRNWGVSQVRLLVRKSDGSDVEVGTVASAAAVAAPSGYDGLFRYNQPHAGGYDFSFDTTQLPNGSYWFIAQAWDAAGNRGEPDYASSRHYGHLDANAPTESFVRTLFSIAN